MSDVRSRQGAGPDRSPSRPIAAGAGEWQDLVVVVAANNWSGTKLHDRHVAERLTTFAPVLYVDPPLSHVMARADPVLTAAVHEPRLRIVAPRIARLTPVVLPFPLRAGMQRVTDRLVRRALRRAVAALAATPAAVLSGAPMLGVFGVCGERRSVYWAQDDYAALADRGGPSAARVRAAEQQRTAEADVIVAANPQTEARLRSSGRPVVLVPYGCDAALFAGVDDAPWPADVDLPPPIAGFVGHLNFRTDPSLLEAVADRGVSVLLVGPRSPDLDIQSLLTRPNVAWVGPKPFADLPSYQRAIDVGLVPYTHCAFNEASFPLKTLEYLAAGRPVVSTDLPATRWLDTCLVAVADDPASFAGAVERLANEPRSPAAVAARRRFAARHSWEVRARQLAEVLGVGGGR